MGLQNFLMNRLIENSVIGKKIQSGDNVSKKGQFALDATEKNPNIEDSMAEKIANLENETKKIDNSVKKIISLPNGASTGDAQIEEAKVGIEGETYDTLGDAIREQVKTYRDVDVSNSKPTGKARVWVNTASNDTESQDILLPQVDDNNVSEENTWSSKKIDSEIGEVREDLDSYINSEIVIRYFEFESGGYDSNTGEKLDDLITEIRSVDKVELPQTTLYVESGYRAYLIKVNNDQIVDRIGWAEGYIHVDSGSYLIRLAKTSSGQMSTDLYKNIYYTEVVLYFKDYSKSLSDGYIYDLFDYDLFERGQYLTTDGTIVDNDQDSFAKRYRSKTFLDDKIQFIKCDENLLMYLIRYDSTGIYKETLKPSNQRVLLENGTTYKYKVFVYKSDDSQMNDKDLEKIHLYYKNIGCPDFYRKSANFIGDSITQGVNTTRTYHEMLNDYIGFKKSNNYGANGTTISVYENCPAPDAEICRRISSIDSSADINFVFGGTNDFYRDVPIGTLFNVDDNGNRAINYDESTFIGAYNKICKHLADNFPTKLNILLTPIHRSTFSNQYTDLQCNAKGLYLESYADAVRDVAKLWNFCCIDLYNDSGLNPSNSKNAKIYFHDGSDGKPVDLLHPNNKGHERIAKTIFAKLKTISIY